MVSVTLHVRFRIPAPIHRGDSGHHALVASVAAHILGNPRRQYLFARARCMCAMHASDYAALIGPTRAGTKSLHRYLAAPWHFDPETKSDSVRRNTLHYSAPRGLCRAPRGWPYSTILSVHGSRIDSSQLGCEYYPGSMVSSAYKRVSTPCPASLTDEPNLLRFNFNNFNMDE